jgi:hypothetical protein
MRNFTTILCACLLLFTLFCSTASARGRRNASPCSGGSCSAKAPSTTQSSLSVPVEVIVSLPHLTPPALDVAPMQAASPSWHYHGDGLPQPGFACYWCGNVYHNL